MLIAKKSICNKGHRTLKIEGGMQPRIRYHFTGEESAKVIPRYSKKKNIRCIPKEKANVRQNYLGCTKFQFTCPALEFFKGNFKVGSRI